MSHDVHDRVARRTGSTWALGTVTGVDNVLLIRWDDASTILVARLDDERIVGVDDVPIDERHWLTEQERDQLVRQEAAERLREMWRALPDDCSADALLDIAYRLATFDAHGGPDPDPKWATAARCLLVPAPQPVTAS